MDCADRDRVDEARQELHRIVNDREMKDAIILIFANKQDLPDGESFFEQQFASQCYLHDLFNDRLKLITRSKVLIVSINWSHSPPTKKLTSL